MSAVDGPPAEAEDRAIEDGLRATESAMRQALAAGGEAVRPVYGWLTYHLGWSELDGRAVSASRGKQLRPRACLLAAAASGALTRAATHAAAAIELAHAFSLIHDDLEDGDTLRRGRPALWTRIGAAQAINSGDLMLILARLALGRADLDAATLVSAYGRFDSACRELAEGQYLDLSFESRPAVSLADYQQMVGGKTGALLGAAMALGALAGGADEALASSLDAVGRRIGTAFQMWDDVLGLWGHPEITGKPVGEDLRRRKRSLPIVLATADAELRGPLVAWLTGVNDQDDQAVAGLLSTFERQGIRQAASEMAIETAEEALSALGALRLKPGPARALAAMAKQAVRRDA